MILLVIIIVDLISLNELSKIEKDSLVGHRNPLLLKSIEYFLVKTSCF